jgi:hypothetical protein
MNETLQEANVELLASNAELVALNAELSLTVPQRCSIGAGSAVE